MKELVIVVPYFGNWPFWFQAFLQSCRFNRDVNWVFYTDCGVPNNIPKNCRFIELTFDEYKILVSKQLGINFHPKNAYKLCDIKPLLGYIHQDDIKDYNFWAFGDIDVIYGDILSCYRPLMKKYDFISTHITRASGHLSVIKNNDMMRTAFMNVKNWAKSIENPEHVCFDEKCFTKLFIKNKNWPTFARNIRDQFNPLRKLAFFHEGQTTPNCRIAWHDGSRNFPLWWKWKQGKLTNSLDGNKEYPYLHFMFWKGDIWTKPEEFPALYSLTSPIGKEFYISVDGFHSSPAPI